MLFELRPQLSNQYCHNQHFMVLNCKTWLEGRQLSYSQWFKFERLCICSFNQRSYCQQFRLMIKIHINTVLCFYSFPGPLHILNYQSSFSIEVLVDVIDRPLHCPSMLTKLELQKNERKTIRKWLKGKKEWPRLTHKWVCDTTFKMHRNTNNNSLKRNRNENELLTMKFWFFHLER